MTFKQNFDTDAWDGESIECIVKRDALTLRCVATIADDEDSDGPEDRDEEFWPHRSDYPVGCKGTAKFQRAYGQAALVKRAYQDNEWTYCGVSVTVSMVDDPDDAPLNDGDYSAYMHGDELMLVEGYACALWSIELNYPCEIYDRRKRRNTRLREVANDLLPEAVDEAVKSLTRMVREKVSQGAGVVLEGSAP